MNGDPRHNWAHASNYIEMHAKLVWERFWQLSFNGLAFFELATNRVLPFCCIKQHYGHSDPSTQLRHFLPSDLGIKRRYSKQKMTTRAAQNFRKQKIDMWNIRYQNLFSEYPFGISSRNLFSVSLPGISFRNPHQELWFLLRGSVAVPPRGKLDSSESRPCTGPAAEKCCWNWSLVGL